MVRILSSSIVRPSEATPKGCLWLSACDQMQAWTHSPTIYIYRPNPYHSQSAIDTLARSLSNILVPYYPLAGRLRSIGGGRVEADCNALGVQLLHAESPKTIDDYGDFKPDETIQELLPKADYTKPIEQIPLLLVQLTRFGCGGLCLGIAISHSMVDGIAAIQFINSWAKLARGETLEEHDMPSLDRTVLRCRTPLMPPRFEHPEFEPLPLLLGASDATAERKKETTVELLKLTGEEVEKIKKKASEGMNVTRDSTARPYTRYEAMTAHIWRCACKARKHDYHQPTTVRITGDIRNRLKPPLPRTYFGNAVLLTLPRNVTSGEVISNPLSYSAEKIREAIELLKEDYIRSQLDLIERAEDMDSLRVSFHTLGCVKLPFSGNPNMHVVSWTSMPMYDADFGWGRPLFVGAAALNADAKVFILPAPTQDGSLIISIRLQAAHMPDFKNYFYQDL